MFCLMRNATYCIFYEIRAYINCVEHLQGVAPAILWYFVLLSKFFIFPSRRVMMHIAILIQLMEWVTCLIQVKSRRD